MNNYEKIEEAKALLKENGYQVYNLWCIEDVQSEYKCTDDEAHGVLIDALQNEATMNQIWFALHFHAEEEGLEKIDDEE